MEALLELLVLAPLAFAALFLLLAIALQVGLRRRHIEATDSIWGVSPSSASILSIVIASALAVFALLSPQDDYQKQNTWEFSLRETQVGGPTVSVRVDGCEHVRESAAVQCSMSLEANFEAKIIIVAASAVYSKTGHPYAIHSIRSGDTVSFSACAPSGCTLSLSPGIKSVAFIRFGNEIRNDVELQALLLKVLASGEEINLEGQVIFKWPSSHNGAE